MTSPDAAAVYLVHGTFANKATWIDPASPFSCRLSHDIRRPLEIHPFRWSGHNSFAARLRASHELAEVVAAAISANPSEQRFICSHSHGGNVVSYMLYSRPDIACRINGGVFLSTPFFSYRLLPSWEFLINGFFSPLLVFGFLAMFALAGFLVVKMIDLEPLRFLHGNVRNWIEMAVFTLINFISITAGFGAVLFINRLKRLFMRSRLLSARQYLKTLSSQLPQGFNALFIHTSGDEAAAFLSFMQVLTWTVAVVNIGVARLFQVLSRLWGYRKPKSILKILFLILCFSVVYTWAVSVQDRAPSIAQAKSSSVADYIYQLGATFVDRAEVWLASTKNLRTDWPVFVALTFLFATLAVINLIFYSMPIFFSVSLLIFFINWVLNFTFGRLPFLAGGLLQVAVEQTPPGTWSVINVPWNRQRAAVSTGLFWRHSNPYNLMNVVDQVSGWISRSIG